MCAKPVNRKKSQQQNHTLYKEKLKDIKLGEKTTVFCTLIFAQMYTVQYVYMYIHT